MFGHGTCGHIHLYIFISVFSILRVGGVGFFTLKAYSLDAMTRPNLIGFSLPILGESLTLCRFERRGVERRDL